MVRLGSRADRRADIDDRWLWRTMLGLALLFVVAAGISEPMSPLFDPDEGYYPATAAETLRSGTFWDLRFNGAPRWEKPILTYAFIEAMFRVLGESAVAARVPSALEGAALIVAVGFLVRRLTTARAGAISACVVATTLGVSIFSRIAHPEIAIVLSIVVSELLICVWLTTPARQVRRHVALEIGVSVAFGWLAKGPAAVVLPLLMLIAALPFVQPMESGVMSGIGDAALASAVAAGLILPWYLAMVARHGWIFLQEALWQQNVGRYTTSTYGHGASVFGLLLPTLVGLLPWTASLPAAVKRLRWRTGGSREVLRTGMVVSAASAFAFYSLSRSKLASYAFVCIPPLAIVIGLLLDEDLDRPSSMDRTAHRTALLLGSCALLLLAVPFGASHFLSTRQVLGGIRPGASDLGALLAPVAIPVGCLTGVVALVLVLPASSKRRLTAVAAVGALAPVLFLATARSTLTEMYPWEVFGREIAARPGPVWLLDRRAPSLTFYAGRPISFAPDVETLETELRKNAIGWLVLTDDQWAQLSGDAALNPKKSVLVAERGRMVLVWFNDVHQVRR